MTSYKAILVHGERGGEGEYVFEAPEGVIKKSAFTTVRYFMEFLSTKFDSDEFEWHVNAAFKNKGKAIVTAMGVFEFHSDDEQPFVCYISEV